MTALSYQDFLQVASRKLCDPNNLGQHNALLLVNFERLAELDGVLGFNAVDAVVRQISSQVKDALSAESLVGITGRYQICCLLVELLSDAHAILAAHKILRILMLPVVLDKRNITLAPRIGVALSNKSGCALDQLLSDASLAIHQARLEQESIKLLPQKRKIRFFPRLISGQI